MDAENVSFTSAAAFRFEVVENCVVATGGLRTPSGMVMSVG
jgi:hypothetical protein